MKKYALYTCVLLLLMGCRSPKYLPKPKEFKHHVKGLFLEVKTSHEEVNIKGEIIGVTADSINLLLKDQAGLRTIARKEIQSAEIVVALTSNYPKQLGYWAAFINLAPIRHGYFMVFSVPVNLATFIAMANVAAKATYRIKYPEDIYWYELSKFARFPQGIPENVDAENIE